MVYLDQLWHKERFCNISGQSVRVPFAVNLPFKLVEFLMIWISKSGGEWTAKRTKSLKIWALQILAGNRDFSLPWFKRTRYKGYTIPDLRIFKHLLDNLSNLKEVRKVLMVLNSYRLGTWGCPSLTSVVEGEQLKPTDHYIPLITKYVNLPRCPEFVLETEVAVNTRKLVCDDLGSTFPGPYALKDFEFPAELALTFSDENKDPWVIGKLTAVPDKGKWRTILVGHWAIQLKTKKLANWLRRWLWDQPEVASGDQKKMIDFMKDSLKDGKYLLSIDLSNATDRLSREFQINLLHHMGVPKDYFKFLELPFYYDPYFFGKGVRGAALERARYIQGQPMGLYISFPMFELMHYVILKFVTAITNAEFRILGDDVVISCSQQDATILYSRYENLIRRLGGSIEKSKTLESKVLAEGAGCIVLKGSIKEIRIPSSAISPVEANMDGTWLNQQVRNRTPIGRAISFPWLMTRENKVYTHDHRRRLNEQLIFDDHDEFHISGLRYLAEHRTEPATWKSWEEPPSGIGLETPRDLEEKDLLEDEEVGFVKPRFKWIPFRKFADSQISNKLITLYKKEKKGYTHEE